MRSYIEKMGRMGVMFLKEQAINLVLLSLPKSYGQFLENFHMRNLDVTLIDLTEILITIQAEMLKSTTKVEMLEGSNPKSSLDVDNGNQENVSLPNRKGLTKIKPFYHMVKRNAHSKIIPNVDPN